MKMVAITVAGLALVLSLFGVVGPMNHGMSGMGSDITTMGCADASCSITPATSDCSPHCLMTAGTERASGALPMTTILLAVLTIVTALLPIRPANAPPRLAFEPIAYRDPRQILSIVKRE